MDDVQAVIALVAVVAAISALALRSTIPYPVALLLSGAALALVPGMPAPQLDPDLVLLLFVPPLVYAAAFLAPLPELRAAAPSVSALAIGLTTATLVAVAVAAHYALGLAWEVAFVLGAILGPTDPVAATAVIRRLGARERLVSLLEGEALVNDALALIAYRVAVAAAVSGSFSLLEAGAEIVFGAVAGVAIGLVVGWAATRLRRLAEEPLIDATLSLLTPFAAYIPAEQVHASGILAAVFAGLYVSARSTGISSPESRVRTAAVWELVIFLLNAVLFLLIGLQLPAVVESLGDRSLASVAGAVALATGVLVGVRALWMFSVGPLTARLDRGADDEDEALTPSERWVAALSGMRGAVSLALALAVPLELDSGAPFPDRDLILFATFAVIVLTMAVPGLTLPALIRRLGLVQDREARAAAIEARLDVVHAALARIEEEASANTATEDEAALVRAMYEARRDRLDARRRALRHGRRDDPDPGTVRLRRAAIEAERATLERLRTERALSADALVEIERDIDLDEAALRSRSAR